jgi:Xaa-Pro aminopeptidase
VSEAILLYGESYHHPTILWRTGFLAPDPVIYIEAAGQGTLLASPLELTRAQKQAKVDRVRSVDDFGWTEIRRKEGELRADATVIARMLEELGISRVRVEPDFPLALAQELQAGDVEVVTDAELFGDGRRRKNVDEVEAVRATQGAAQAAVERARTLLREAAVRDGMLYHGGEPVTSSTLIAAIEAELLSRGCAADGTIATGGPGSADPHATDTGHLAADQPVIIDIFPQHKGTRYYGDITRTFVVGTPSETWLRMYDAVHRAYQAALDAVRPGVAGRDVHLAACQVLYDAGFSTLVDGLQREGVAQMNHGTGHGLGLEVHEAPRVSDAPSVLQPGDVITIEPGLYHPAHGGVRIEDTVVVTEDGYRNLTDYPVDWKP